MDEYKLKQIIEQLNIEQIPIERNYWLIRTESGVFYNDFYTNNYVSIGWDEFSNKKMFEETKEEKIKEIISNTYKDEKRPGYIYNQVKRFMFDIKEDDMVLIPSTDSKQIAFGIVTKAFYTRETPTASSDPQNQKCKFKKCINVKWIRKAYKENLSVNLRLLLFTHTTISDINNYKNFINKQLYSNYVIDNEFHSVFNVTTTKNINGIELMNFLDLVLSQSIDLFNTLGNTTFSKKDIDIKLNVQSPGPIEFIGYGISAIIWITAINAFLFGIKFKGKIPGTEIDVENNGILKAILEFTHEKNQNNQRNKELEIELIKAKNTLKLKSSEELLLAPSDIPEESENSRNDFQQIEFNENQND